MRHANPIDFKSENFRDYGDPYVLRHNGTYYLYFTSANPEGYPIVYSSSDLLHWKNEGEITKDEKALFIWSPRQKAKDIMSLSLLPQPVLSRESPKILVQ